MQTWADSETMTLVDYLGLVITEPLTFPPRLLCYFWISQ